MPVEPSIDVEWLSAEGTGGQSRIRVPGGMSARAFKDALRTAAYEGELFDMLKSALGDSHNRDMQWQIIAIDGEELPSS